ncbi:hypothetical protein L226DRAFT_366517 [Lentinus tigrinus ALCF2SS1-7]|uniref:uncharacterized protein n=1 Tax=Lentinus tigrinus ALCF2SS1-7 TaxID=1328758 RepID=UPI0011662E9D|nr:hypothetical protein L226DRAFT_366517 [Lentinus tigrinus ALCF2SS1-7]
MTNVSDVLEPRECRQSSPLRSSFLLVPFSDASYTESRASSPALFQDFSTIFRYPCLLQTHPYNVRTACPTWHPGASWEERGGNMNGG